MNMLDPGGMGWDFIMLLRTVHNVKLNELVISGIFRLIFSDHH